MPRRNVLVLAVLLWAWACAAIAEDWIYTTRPGDTLWDLTEKYAKSLGYVEALRKRNQVTTPKLLRPGTRLRFPVRWLKLQPASARVAEATGDVKLRRADATDEESAAAGETLRFGDTILIGEDALAVLEFADGSTVIVRAGSAITLDRLSAYGDTGMVDTGLRLQGGRITIQTAPSRGPGTRFRIKTPAAVSTVRGTQFRVAVDGGGAVARTEVTAGLVEVGREERIRRVPERFGIVAAADKPLAEPVPLLPAPRVSELPLPIERVPVRLDWSGVQGAQSYRVQVAETGDFRGLLLDRIVTAPRASFDATDNGEYFLRLRSIDPDGLEGTDGVQRFTLNAFPVPPTLIEPKSAARVHIPRPDFQWTAPLAARSYHLQLSDNAAFAEPIVDMELDGNRGFKPGQPLQPGTYFWRVATRNDQDALGPFGDTASFTYTPPPPAPENIEIPEPSNKYMELRWSRGAPEDQYRFQLARRGNFETPLVDTILDDPVYALQDAKSGPYSLRVATVDQDGLEGAFGDPQTFKIPYQFPAIPTGFLIIFLLVL